MSLFLSSCWFGGLVVVCAGAAASVGGGYGVLLDHRWRGWCWLRNIGEWEFRRLKNGGNLGRCSVKGGGRNVVVVEDDWVVNCAAIYRRWRTRGCYALSLSLSLSLLSFLFTFFWFFFSLLSIFIFSPLPFPFLFSFFHPIHKNR